MLQEHPGCSQHTHTHTRSEKISGVYYPINKRVEQERHAEGWAQPGAQSMNYRKRNYYSQKQLLFGSCKLVVTFPPPSATQPSPVPSGSSRDFSCCVSRVGGRLQAKFNRGEHTLITLRLCHSCSHLLILFPSALGEE